MERRARKLMLQCLESRDTPAVSSTSVLSGAIFADYNGNGGRDAIEKPQSGVIVRIDLNSDGTFDATATTKSDGTYSFTGVANGAHKIVVTVPGGFSATSPTSLAVIASGSNNSTLNFALQPLGAIGGTAFNDSNFNGVLDGAETVLGGVSLSLNLFNDGATLLSATSDSNGQYQFLGVPNGTHTLTASLGGFSKSTANPVGVNITNAANVSVNPGFAASNVISGYAYSDSNSNSILDGGERLLPNYSIALDLNNDGVNDASALTDANGQFHFVGVASGLHKVALQNATATPASRTVNVGTADVTGISFAVQPSGTLSGIAFNDANASGVQDPGEAPLAGVTVTVDLFSDGSVNQTTITGQDGRYSFAGLPDGSHLVNASRAGSFNSTPNNLTATYNLGTLLYPPLPTYPPSVRKPGDPVVFPTPNVPTQFGLTASNLIGGYVYADTNKSGSPDIGESELPGVTVKLDRNNDGTWDETAITDAYGRYAFAGVPDGKHTIAIAPPVGYTSATALSKTIAIAAGNSTGNAFPLIKAVPSNAIAVATDSPLMNQVNFFSNSGTQTGKAEPFGSTGETRVATGDVTGDGIDDYAVATGPGRPTQVRVINGATKQELFSTFPFGEKFTGGAFVALGDISGDGRADLVISPDLSGGPRVTVLDGEDFSTIADFYGIDDPKFRGGVRVAIGDLNHDGRGDVIVAAGYGGGPRIALYDGAKLGILEQPKLADDFFAFEEALRNGAYVAAADMDGDGFADLVVGAGSGGSPRVSAFNGQDLLGNKQTRFVDFFAGREISDRSGARVATADLDGDGLADILVGYRHVTNYVPRLAGYTAKTVLKATAYVPPTFDIEPFPTYVGTIYVG